MFKYFPHTALDIETMLTRINARSINDLFADVPSELMLKEALNLEAAKSEVEIRMLMQSLAAKNNEKVYFLGGGAYDHYIPSVIPALVSRQEFLTAYTPYQPEIAQGTLSYIFEFQSYMTSLTGLDVSNASMYDGATATAEAIMMAVADRKINHVLISETLHPAIIATIKTYATYRGFTFSLIPSNDGITNLYELKKLVQDPFAAILMQSPNYFGLIEDMAPISALAKAHGGLFIMNVDPASLAVLKSPGEYGADIACGDAQTLGIPLSFGGPHLGFLCAKEKLLRRMPGRICGISKDVDGKRAFVLTLQAREQHIRREKANSNICSNQSLMALWVTIYMSIMGKAGLRQVQLDSLKNARYLHEKLIQTKLFKPVFNAPFFYEFALTSTLDEKVMKKALEGTKFEGPLSAEYHGQKVFLFAATEKRTQAEIDEFVRALEVSQ